MSTDNKPRIQLRVVGKSQSPSEPPSKIQDTPVLVESQEKKKGRRGRPRKNPIDSTKQPIETSTSKQPQPKKGDVRKNKKPYTVYQMRDQKAKLFSPPAT